MIDSVRLSQQLKTLQTITGPGKGINRLAFTDSDWQGRQYLCSLMEAAGLSIRTDAFGNVIGHYAGLDESLPAILIGSHGDSVPEGGNFDGIVGLLTAIETVHSMKEDHFIPDHPLEIVLFMCEESSRFGAATLGSRAMRGELSLAEIHQLHDAAHHSLFDILKARGLDPEHIESARYTRPLKACFEVHIEQGKVLEHKSLSVGIVTGIAAPTRLMVHLHGCADHSGATPMDLRHDGLCAASEIILAVEQTAKTACNPPVVGTVGRLDLSPNAMNVIPGEVQLGIDVRSISAKARATVIAGIRASISQITTARKIPYTIEEISSDQPAAMHPSVIQLLASLCEENQIPYDQLPSGAGHDIMHWADYVPCGMLFIPCRHGISHNPDEYADLEDITRAANILSQAVRRVSACSFHWVDPQ